MNAICAAGARTTAERVATTPAPLKAKGDEGSRRYIIILSGRSEVALCWRPTGGQKRSKHPGLFFEKCRINTQAATHAL